jgi:hypothetical protein
VTMRPTDPIDRLPRLPISIRHLPCTLLFAPGARIISKLQHRYSYQMSNLGHTVGRITRSARSPNGFESAMDLESYRRRVVGPHRS